MLIYFKQLTVNFILIQRSVLRPDNSNAMKVNEWVIAIIVVSVLAFVYFIVKRNKVDQKNLERDLNEREVKPDRHDEPRV